MPEEVEQPAEEADWSLYEAEEQTGKIPAQYANRLFVKPDGNMLRLSFGEQAGDEVIYRTSFIVPAQTALEMGDLLTRMATANVDHQINAWRDWIAVNPPETSDG